ncbi:universal stress protein [Streptomyces sp. NPDC049879]|uniref:universal stress protein n=1 Tax=Streptomyces sp. NPDC049879 TaxID=3365598 RepID=UPI00379F4A18
MDRTDGQRVVVGVNGSLGSMTALHRAADEARRRGASLMAALAWTVPLGGMRRPGPEAQADAFRLAARDQLRGALRAAFGGMRMGVPVEAVVIEGQVGEALVSLADRPDDLLVVGTGRRGLWRRLTGPSPSRYCLAHAGCPVLAVPHAPLHDDLDALRQLGRRGAGLGALLPGPRTPH